jgi:pilus assembly protein CpaE
MKKILVVDDEPDALRMVKLTLSSEGYEVVTGSDGEEAIRIATLERPDLILLDVMMPGINGYEVTRRLRRVPELAQVPILFLSARGQVEDKVEGLRAGGNDYVTKPADPVELVARVGALLGSYTEAPGYVAALFGSKGGVGTTTLAVNLALCLRQQSEATVVLVDGHNEGGDVGVFLNTPISHHAGELMAVIDQLDKDVFQSALASHSSGLRMLLAPSDASSATAILPTHWERMLHELRRIASYIIFDGPPLQSASWAPVLDEANDVFLITTPDITAMRRLRSAYAIAGASSGATDNRNVVLNRFTEQSGFSVSAINRALAVPVRLRIEDIGPVSSYALNRGEPLVLSDRRSPLTRALTGLAREILQHAPQPLGASAGRKR